MHDGKTHATIVIQQDEASFVHKAVQDLVSDINKITGEKLQISNTKIKGKPNLIIGTVSQSALIPAGFKALQGKWECYSIRTTGEDLVIAGSNPRGTMFGIYYFIEKYLKVDPFYWWKDIEQEQQQELVFAPIDYMSNEPCFKFRGWFINDEDLLTGFMDGGGERKLDYPFYRQVIAPQLAEKIFESAVRLRFNLVIPASFLEISNPAEEGLLKIASSRGLYLSQHHIEPLGVSAFGYFNYWERKTGEKPLFSYYSEKDKVIESWRESAKRWSKYPDVIWQIGLRGIADRPMWMEDPGVPQSDAERAAIISNAMQTQMDILEGLMPGKKHEVTTTLWGEGSYFNEKGLLKFPENTTIVFADNSPGWIMQEDFYKTKREPGINYGIYYHHGLIGSGPHLAQAVPPAKTLGIFSLAKEKQSGYYAILNVGNIREFVLGIEATRDIMEDTEGFNPNLWMEGWCKKNFGEDYPPEIKKAYDEYFKSFVTDSIYQTPLLLDGLSTGIIKKNLREIKKLIANTNCSSKTESKHSQDAFYKSLQSANPGGGLSHNMWLKKAGIQDSVLSLAMGKAQAAIQNKNIKNRAFLENNLVSQIKIMQYLTGSVTGTSKAVISLQGKDLGSAKKHLQEASGKFYLYQEAVGLNSRGKWKNWYRGEKKLNIKQMQNDMEETLGQLHNTKLLQ